MIVRPDSKMGSNRTLDPRFLTFLKNPQTPFHILLFLIKAPMGAFWGAMGGPWGPPGPPLGNTFAAVLTHGSRCVVVCILLNIIASKVLLSFPFADPYFHCHRIFCAREPHSLRYYHIDRRTEIIRGHKTGKCE